MNILPEIITTLTKEEIRNYKLFIKRTNDTGDRKDELLFDLIKKYNTASYNEDAIFKKVYDSENKNPFYRLKNKLQDDIGLSLTFFYFNSTDINVILKDVFLAKIFFDKNAWQISKYYLNKAEKRATEIENYDLLDLIYTEFIKLSHELLDINPETYVYKRIENKKQLDELREIDNILAVVIYKIRSAQTFDKSVGDIGALLEEKINALSADKNRKHTVQIKLKIYHSVSRLLLLKQDYQTLEKYSIKSFREFEKEQLFTKTNHDTKLHMLVYICNALFKTKKYAKSIEYSTILKESINQYDAFSKNKYLFFYYNALVINYTETDRPKAIQTLLNMQEVPEIKTHPAHANYVWLNLATVYYDDAKYKLSLKSIIELTTSDSFKNLDEAFRLKIHISELLVRYMLKDFEFIETIIKSIFKLYDSLLKQASHQQDETFIKIIKQLCKASGDLKAGKLKEDITNYILAHENTFTKQTEVINHIEWLKVVSGR